MTPDNNRSKCFIGIDTSNYTTSIAACDENGHIFMNLRRLLDVKNGECGLRQSEAVFSHIKNLPIMLEEVSEIIKDYDIAAVGCSDKPRDVKDSYMPCFLAGVNSGASMGAALKVPFFRFSHQSGHIMAAAYSCGKGNELFEKDFCSFHISGGTTEILHITPNMTGDAFNVSLIGGTNDLNAGQAIDRTGVMMGLNFPCGREMEILSDMCCDNTPKPHISVTGLTCNLSGLESLAAKVYANTKNKMITSRFVFDFLADTFTELGKNLLVQYPGIAMLFAGGVMSNKYLQTKLSEKFEAYFAAPEFSADNASGTALMCRLKYKKKQNNQ